jgi:hypothetical protein
MDAVWPYFRDLAATWETDGLAPPPPPQALKPKAEAGDQSGGPRKAEALDVHIRNMAVTLVKYRKFAITFDRS